MKYIESVLFALSVMFVGVLFNPLLRSIAWADILIMAVACIFLGMGIYFREKRLNMGQNEIMATLKAMTNQQKDFISVIIQSNKHNDTNLQELKNSLETVTDVLHGGFQGLQGTLDESIYGVLKKIQLSLYDIVNETIKDFRVKVEENDSKMYSLFDQKSRDVLEELKSSKTIIEQQLNVINGSIKQGNDVVSDFQSSLLRNSRDLADSSSDLAANLVQVKKIVKEVLSGIESSNETQAIFYENHTEKMVSNQASIEHAARDIQQYRDKIGKELSDRTNELINLVLQLSKMIEEFAESKHFDRQRVFDVQKQLVKQFERLNS